MHYSKIAGAIVGAALSLMACNAFAASGEVVVDAVNIRAGASTDTAIVGKAYAGEKLNVEGKTNNFYILNYNGSTAYACEEFVSIISIGRGTVNTDVLNMRASRSTSSDILGKLSYGEEVNIIGSYDGWYQILRYGSIYYVSSDYISTNDIHASAAVSRGSYSRTGSSVVSFSQNYLGVPYVSGGSSPSGFDCSGFTSYVYSNFGVSLPHSAAAQANHGVAVSRGDIQPGDLLFFNTYGGISHVGIAVDSDRFIHATVPGDVVKYGSLSSSYYGSRFVTARRVLR